MRKLPPLKALRAFEAAARHMSFKAAADELGLTPTAISHQIRLLETALGGALFRRRPRPLTLTPPGAALFPVDLSRISGAFVIARNTAFAYKGKTIDLRQIGRDLNVRYALQGSVQRGGNRLRVNVQLIDCNTSTHLWAGTRSEQCRCAGGKGMGRYGSRRRLHDGRSRRSPRVGRSDGHQGVIADA